MSTLKTSGKISYQTNALSNKKPDKALYVPPARRSANRGLTNESSDVKDSNNAEQLEASFGALRISDGKAFLPRNGSQSSLESSIDHNKFLHVIELYDFPKDIETADLQAELSGFEDSGFYLKWVDDTHCLAVFSSPNEAERALQQISGIVFKARRFADACPESKRKLAKSPGDWAMPYKRRPPTTSVTANRLISRHLGLKVEQNAAKLAQQDRDRQALQEARAQNEARRRAQKAIWDDESLDFPSKNPAGCLNQG